MGYICGGGGGYGYDMFGFGWIFMIVFWLLIIWAIVALIQYLLRSNRWDEKDQDGKYPGRRGTWEMHRRGREDGALEILRERYAKGEISREEFESRKKELMNM